ncbi:DUF6457 domain-containing protein [Nesterenkonia sp.]|uniref:DUF6457 domain-containing protein n=1 Tax=Nesterenkonia sp. TaxID=704201 RepID=UPI00262DECE0|nr:DUF6457 domain-containing protein [Nesterenkonia sp.]
MTEQTPAAADALSAPTREALELWIRELVHHLEVEGLQVDVESVVRISDYADSTVVDPAGPVTTFLIGYVAGLAEASGQADFATCHRAATRVAERLLNRRRAAVG